MTRAEEIPCLMAVWESYRTMVYGPGPLPKAQEDECRRAFFAGIAGAFNFVAGLDDDQKSNARLDLVIAELSLVPSLEFPGVILPPMFRKTQ